MPSSRTGTPIAGDAPPRSRGTVAGVIDTLRGHRGDAGRRADEDADADELLPREAASRRLSSASRASGAHGAPRRGFLSTAKNVALLLLVDLPRTLVALGGDIVVTVATAGNKKSRLAKGAVKNAAKRWGKEWFQDDKNVGEVKSNVGRDEYDARVYHPFISRTLTVALTVEGLLLLALNRSAQDGVPGLDAIYADGTASDVLREQRDAIVPTYEKYAAAAGVLGDVGSAAASWSWILLAVNSLCIATDVVLACREHRDLIKKLGDDEEQTGAEGREPHPGHPTFLHRFLFTRDGSVTGWNLFGIFAVAGNLILCVAASHQGEQLRLVAASDPNFAAFTHPTLLKHNPF